jgi:hypothetical protein
MKKTGLLTLGFGLVAAIASAQGPTSYTLKISNQGAPSPFTSAVLPAASFLCGQTPKIVVTGTAVNPGKVVFDDPPVAPATVSTADCVYVDQPGDIILSLPFTAQVYTATLVANYPAGSSLDSAVSNPFSRPAVVGPVPVGLRISR